jgi:hypothetical protein
MLLLADFIFLEKELGSSYWFLRYKKFRDGVGGCFGKEGRDTTGLQAD